jgi:ketosteroid isomerase-like protein
MKSATRKRSTVLAAVTLITLSAGWVLAASNAAPEVRDVVAGFATTWNRHDMNAFGRLFAPDADFVNVAGDLWLGRQTIQAQHAYSHGAIPVDSPGFSAEDQRFHGIFRNSTLKFDSVDVRFLRRDVAVAHVSWTLMGDSRTANPRRGVFVFVITRQSGEWLIATAQNTEIERTVK